MIAPFAYTGTPARVIFGQDTIGSLRAEAAALGLERVLVLSTPRQTDLADHVRAILGELAVGAFAGAWMHTPVSVTTEAEAAARHLKLRPELRLAN